MCSDSLQQMTMSDPFWETKHLPTPDTRTQDCGGLGEVAMA